MSQKQDRINEVLAERISQLENELQAALNDKDRAEKEVSFVKDEAYEVVGQWSAENAELRRRLSALEENAASTEAALKNREETLACLKEELLVAQQLSAQYSSLNEELQNQKEVSEKKIDELSADLSSAQKSVTASAQKVGDYERLVSKFEVELKGLLAAHQQDERSIDELRKSLQSASDENRILRQAGEDVSSSTGKLLERVCKLKDENELLTRSRDRLFDEAQNLKLQAEKARVDAAEKNQQIERLSADLLSATSATQRLGARVEDLETKLQDASIALQVSETAAAQQLDLIQNLEKDIQEMRDNGITADKALGDLQAELEYTKQQVEELTQGKEDLQTEFTTVKECYSAILIEFDDHKSESSRAIEALKKELAVTEKNSTDRVRLMEQNSNSAWSSVQELTGALHAQQKSEFVKKEQISRLTIALDQQAGWAGCQDHRLRAISQLLFNSMRSVESGELRIRQAELAAAKSEEQLETVNNRCRACEQTLSEQRKAFASLESKLSRNAALLKENAAERETLTNDNEWLKKQVESMRQELGELDEILNSSLNEMREENERLQLENERLQQRISSSEEKDKQNDALVQKLEASAATQESELRAQTKTLEITEAELQASKAQLENALTSLHFLQKRAEEVEALNGELVRTNAALSCQVTELQERVGSQDVKLSSVLSDKRKESDGVKAKLSLYVERCEKAERLLRAESDAKRDAESAVLATKEQNSKLRAALDELKSRCASDATTLRELLAERDDLMRDRDIIVEKYNKMHDAFRSMRKEAHGKVADELRKVMELAVSQEAELQTLRQQNTTLKKSVSMFVESAQPKAEAIFTERLNLTEGPLRHPKKRSAANANE